MVARARKRAQCPVSSNAGNLERQKRNPSIRRDDKTTLKENQCKKK
jgi:hypothetical protein